MRRRALEREPDGRQRADAAWRRVVSRDAHAAHDRSAPREMPLRAKVRSLQCGDGFNFKEVLD
jgi:hypothetical protein